MLPTDKIEKKLLKMKLGDVHILDQIITSKGKKMYYYREKGSYPTDIKTIIMDI